jgi:AbiV family abortive infection protein
MYEKALNNAEQLLRDAEILFERQRFARAYFLALTGLEEIAKSQLAADVWTGFIEEKEFRAYFEDHPKKIKSVKWASSSAKEYEDVEQGTYLEINHPTTTDRMNALYTHFDGGEVVTPNELFTEDKARAIIHTLRVAIHRVIENDFFGYGIGTKGFM